MGMKIPEKKGENRKRKKGKGREREGKEAGVERGGGISKVKKSVPATNYTLLSIHPSISTPA